MTAVDLDALDAARAAATPGPWHGEADWRSEVAVWGSGSLAVTTGIKAANAACIVAEHNAMPDLIADARKLWVLREAVEGLCSAAVAESERRVPGEPYRSPAVPAARLRAALAAALTSEGERE